MAAGTKGTDPTLDAQLKLMAAQTGLTVAQIQQIADERGIKREELAQRGAIATEGFKVDREKIGLGREEMSVKDKQAKLAAALDALNIGSKEKIAGQSERAGFQSDLTRRPDVPLDVVARTAAANGDPALFNALAAKKLQDREKLVTSMIPALQAAKSDKERETKIKPALEAASPGSYREALARAFPKPGQAVPAATPEPAPPSTVAPTGGETNPLAATLLAAAGFGDGATGSATSVSRNGFPILPNTPEVNYAGKGKASLEGSQVADLGNGRSRITTPSGGTIGFQTPTVESINASRAQNAARMIYGEQHPSELIDTKASGGRGFTFPANLAPAPAGSFVSATGGDVNRLARLINPGAQPQLATNVPAPQGAGEPVPPPAFDFGALLTNNATSPVPNPTPQVTPTPVVAPAVNDAAIAQAAELERQRKLREALALQARNSQ